MADTSRIIRGDGAVSMDGRENAESYDAWAEGYDSDLADWDYEAPRQAARLLSANLPGFAGAALLDCGCGTGMTGEALRAAGAEGPVTGIDVSEKSLEIARGKQVYTRVRPVDLNGPLPFEDDMFEGLLCVGVLTYVEAAPLFREWTRVLRPGGVAVFTSRDDLFASRDYPGILAALEAEGRWERLHVSAPMGYLPSHPEFGDKIKVIYCVCRVA